jgi:hypothetical protein
VQLNPGLIQTPTAPVKVFPLTGINFQGGAVETTVIGMVKVADPLQSLNGGHPVAAQAPLIVVVSPPPMGALKTLIIIVTVLAALPTTVALTSDDWLLTPTVTVQGSPYSGSTSATAKAPGW